MAKNLIQIILDSIFNDKGVKDAKRGINDVGDAADKNSGNVGSLGGAFRSLNKVMGALGLAITTKEIFDLGVQAYNSAAQFERLERATNSLSSAVGATGDEMIDSITTASAGMISQFDAAQAANQALMFGIVDNKQQMADLTSIAVTLGNAMGQDAGKSISDMTLALGRQSKLILDNLGIIVDVEGANKKFAESVGKSVEALTDEEKQMIFTNAALEAGRAKVEELGGVAVDSAGRVDQLSASWNNFLTELGRLATESDAGTGVIQAFTDALNGFAFALDAKEKIDDIRASNDEWTGSALAAAASIEDLNDLMQTNVSNIDLLKQGLAGSTYSVEEYNGAIDKLIALSVENLAGHEAFLSTLSVTTDEYERLHAASSKQLEIQNYVAAQTKIHEAAQKAAEIAARDRAKAEADLTDELERQQAVNQGFINLRGAKEDTSEIDRIRANREQVAEINRQKAEDEEREAERRQRAAERESESIKRTADDLANQLSGAVSEAFGRMQETVPGLSEMFAAEDPGEFGRRLGALADGLDPSDMGFIDRFKEQAGGNPIYAALLQAIAESDSAAVAEEAKSLMANNLAQVIATGLAESMAAKLREQDLMAQAQAILAEQMGQAMPAAAGATGEGVKDAQTTSGEVQTALTDMASSTDEFKGKAVSAFAEAKKGGDEFIKTLKEIEKMTNLINGNLEKMTDIGAAQASKFGITPGAAIGGMAPQ